MAFSKSMIKRKYYNQSEERPVGTKAKLTSSVYVMGD